MRSEFDVGAQAMRSVATDDKIPSVGFRDERVVFGAQAVRQIECC